MTDRWVEISDTNLHGVPPRLVHVEDIEGLTGFRSVYSYPRGTCEYIVSNIHRKTGRAGSVEGLVASGLPVFSDRLFMDIDDDPESAAKYVQCLKDWNITHSVWDSGNRSVHIHILVEPKEDWRVPHSQKKFVEDWGAAIGAATDTSIYHAAALYRLPDTVHVKTGRTKDLVSTHIGSSLDYELVERARAHIPESSEEVRAAFWRLMLTTLGVGGRRLHVYKIATHGVQMGMTEDSLLTHLLAWNSWQPHPLTEIEVEEKMWKSV